jgi:hypothetical protein
MTIHNDIKAFKLYGEIAESVNKLLQKDKLLHVLETIIRDNGYVPSLDNDTWFMLEYDVINKDRYTFQAGMYGVYVGKDKSWQISGITNGKSIAMTSPKAI